ncbi:2-amino-4-oxopentanoate thiolase subunit OrtA [Kosmotoga pacifica]|uniref:2-amino-4-ketopentanoate thiolase n=1 Tax=Kosmotoga pacifica TaxID=1330330 RepID=A0A0G2Z9A1_9BACT|nr:2-amino-4-oxopentanoate thiolase subunit OrtA [Kosmotoga pacifica]AKI98137.1 2-amino-4-ketopentanoate thiolase [Kosmotoga pacifica]
MKAKKGQWVQIQSIILKPEERAPQIPEDTKRVPLEMRVKGYLLDAEAILGDDVTVETATGRRVKGKLVAIEPRYIHDFGEHVPVLAEIEREFSRLIDSLKESDDDE